MLGIRASTFDKNQFDKITSSQKLINNFVVNPNSSSRNDPDELRVSGELINLIDDEEIILDNDDNNCKDSSFENDIICVDQTQVSEAIVCDSCSQKLNTLALSDRQINQHITLCKKYSNKSLIEVEIVDCIDISLTPLFNKANDVFKNKNNNIRKDTLSISDKPTKKHKINKTNDPPIGNKVTTYFTKLNKPKK